jgi:hypothetical protein
VVKVVVGAYHNVAFKLIGLYGWLYKPSLSGALKNAVGKVRVYTNRGGFVAEHISALTKPGYLKHIFSPVKNKIYKFFEK